VFERHSEMLLRRDDLSAERINWTDKATNLRELADELSLGLSSFVFLDDNPIEREWVRNACPEVLVPELPDDPTERPAFLRSAPWFDRLGTTSADRERAASYRQQGERRRLETSVVSYDDFLSALEQEVTFAPVDDGSLARAAQLTQRTNQFNLTTKRYTAGELERLIDDSSYELYTLSVRDRFGDSGITGLAIIFQSGDEVHIDTFLMSCRVLGRRLEDAFVHFLAEQAALRGAATLVGVYESTAKNGQVSDFYPAQGFTPHGEGRYTLDLAQIAAGPSGVSIKVGADA
jgi:FkbH-like protein